MPFKKRPAVDGADPLSFQPFVMGFRPVALVLFKGVSRIDLRVFHHHPVPRHLGDDGRRRDGQNLGVSFNKRLLGQFQFFDLDRIEQQVIQRLFACIRQLLFQVVDRPPA